MNTVMDIWILTGVGTMDFIVHDETVNRCITVAVKIIDFVVIQQQQQL